MSHSSFTSNHTQEPSASSAITHIPVMVEEVKAALLGERASLDGLVFVDATVGGGGHALALCQALNETNWVIGLDQDPAALAVAEKTLAGVKPKVSLLRGNFGQLTDRLASLGVSSISGGLLLDLGYSAYQMQSAQRGFSFQHQAPLDMRMDPDQPVTAATLLNESSERDLSKWFFEYANERLARPIARAIVEQRSSHPWTDTASLAKLIQSIYAQKGCHSTHINPATRVFQALRMEVNQELPMLQNCLEQANDLLAVGARLAVISFHSVEDRVVKDHFRWFSSSCVCPPDFPMCICQRKPLYSWTKKAILPTDTEVQTNPQSRSAQLRLVERLDVVSED